MATWPNYYTWTEATQECVTELFAYHNCGCFTLDYYYLISWLEEDGISIMSNKSVTEDMGEPLRPGTICHVKTCMVQELLHRVQFIQQCMYTYYVLNCSYLTSMFQDRDIASTSQEVRPGAWLNSSLLCDVILYHVNSELGGYMHRRQNRKLQAECKKAWLHG